NAPLLVSDDGRLLRGQQLGWTEGTYVAWDTRSEGPTPYDPAAGRYGAPESDLALASSHRVRLAAGNEGIAQPVLAALAELAAQYVPERAETITQVPAARLREAAAILAAGHPVCLYYWNGLAQHTNTTQNARAIGTLFALLGDFDRPGSNVLFPGIRVHNVEARELLSPEAGARRLGRDTHPLGPAARPGQVAACDLYRAVLHDEPYPVKALVGFGGNMLMSSAGPDEGYAALSQLEFFAQAELFLTPTAALADIV